MTDLPVACTLTPGELDARREGLLPGLLRDAARRTALESGYRYEFATTPGLLARIGDVVERERQCCRFLRFQITAEPAGGPVWLDVSGPTGTRAFLDALLQV